MTEFMNALHPYCAIISYVSRTQSQGQRARVPDVHKESAEFEIYIDRPVSPISFSLIERIAIEPADEWEGHIAGVYRLRQRRQSLRDYHSQRYLVRFADNEHPRLGSLLLEGHHLERLASLIRSSDASASGENLRHDQSGASREGWDSAVLIVFDLSTELTTGSNGTSIDPAEIPAFFRAALGQASENFMVQPSRFLNFWFTKGPTIGTVLESAAVLRLDGPLARPVISVPNCAMDWIDFADLTCIVAHLRTRLADVPLVAQDTDLYLRFFESAHIPSFYDRFTTDRTTALKEYLSGRETLNEITTQIRGNTFGPEFIGKFHITDGFSGLQFHRLVADEHQRTVTVYESNERKLLEREKLLSNLLRDASSWHVAEASTELARITNRLIEGGVDLAKTSIALQTASNDIATSTRNAADLIRDATKSTDRLTNWVVFLTIAVVLLTLIGSAGAWVPDPVKERILVHFGISAANVVGTTPPDAD